MTKAAGRPAGPTYFESPEQFRSWLQRHHRDERELWVGFHKRHTGEPGMTWSEAVDQALCFGWTDGQRRAVDADRYAIRFTPRKPGSTWSAVNVRRFEALRARNLVTPAGLAAFAQRTEARSGTYSYEQPDSAVRLAPDEEAALRSNPDAWRFFQDQPPSYRKAAIWWVVSAKREETRTRRLRRLIDDSAAGRTVPPLTRRARTS